MRAIMVMFDSLNRRFLENYGCDFSMTPNFKRLADKCVTFDNFYVGSLPCMPARRDLHTGRYSFLHRSWGPLEPFDNSMPRLLKQNGVYTRLVSDHGHYWEDGGCTYHTQYSSWDCIRGQEADPWAMRADEPTIPKHVPTMREFTHPEWWRDSWCNKEQIRQKNAWPQDGVFDGGIEFLENNADKDNWFLQIENFDPHEPFDVPEEYLKLLKDDYKGEHFDWPSYAPVCEEPDQVKHIRTRYAALLYKCDQSLGRVLDFMDAHDMWKDTMFIVNTDHGFMLGEKDWWAKSVMPCYNELANTPFFLWDPRLKVRGERREELCQTIDIPATLLEFFGVERPCEMQGISLRKVIEKDEKIRDYAIFGFHGSFVNVTDGNYVYMRASASVSNKPLNEYTLMPTHQQGFFGANELKNAEIAEPLPFTKGCRIMKIPNVSRLANATFCNSFQYGNMLFDLRSDPEQLTPIDDAKTEARFVNAMIALMHESDSPAEQFERLGVDENVTYTAERISADRERAVTFDSFPITKKYKWEQNAKNIFVGMLSLLDEKQIDEYFAAIDEVMKDEKDKTVKRKHFELLARKFYSANDGKVFYFLNKLERVK